MLVAKNISKKFYVKEKKSFFKKKEVKVVTATKDVSLIIEPGKIIGLLGVNGAGKTTTIKMLATMLEPTTGTITIDDLDVVKEHGKVKNMINVITGGERNLYWRLTGKENLEYFGALYGISKDKLDKKIDYLLEIIGLHDVKDMPVERYSKGMKQRLQIARGLINDPKYIFLDEPTLGLDISIANELREYIKKVTKSENKGILLTTHYIKEAEELCDYIYVIDKGEIVIHGTTEQLKNHLKTGVETEIEVDNITNDLINGLEELSFKKGFEVKVENNLIRIISKENFTSEVIEYLDANRSFVKGLKTLEPKLEEVLLAVINRRNNLEEISDSSSRRNIETAS